MVASIPWFKDIQLPQIKYQIGARKLENSFRNLAGLSGPPTNVTLASYVILNCLEVYKLPVDQFLLVPSVEQFERRVTGMLDLFCLFIKYIEDNNISFGRWITNYISISCVADMEAHKSLSFTFNKGSWSFSTYLHQGQ